MDELPKAHSSAPRLDVGTEGEFKGWRTWTRDAFETHNGPFWHRMDELAGAMRIPGREEAPQRAAQRPWRLLHGFADYCLSAIARRKWARRHGRLRCEFLDAAREGELIECDGEVTRAGGSLIFLRGTLRSGERKLFTFSGTIKRVKGKKPPAA